MLCPISEWASSTVTESSVPMWRKALAGGSGAALAAALAPSFAAAASAAFGPVAERHVEGEGQTGRLPEEAATRDGGAHLAAPLRIFAARWIASRTRW